MRIVLLLGFTMALSGPALAGDGVYEINQSCAVNTGCFPGDLPGFPVTIGTSGSYVLTGTLAVSSTTARAIQVQASNVWIDLNGFTIDGPGSGTGEGIATMGFGLRHVHVLNGTVQEMGSHGVEIQFDAHIERLTVSENGGNGIDVQSGATIIDSTAEGNAGRGILVDSGRALIR